MISRVSNDILDLNTNIDSAIVAYLKFVSSIAIVCHNSCWIEGDYCWGANMISDTTRLMSERVDPEFKNILDYFLRHINHNLGYIIDGDSCQTIGYLDYSTSKTTPFAQLNSIARDVIGEEKLKYIKNDMLEKMKNHKSWGNAGSRDDLDFFLKNLKVILDDLFKGPKYPEEIGDYLADYSTEYEDVETCFEQLKYDIMGE